MSEENPNIRHCLHDWVEEGGKKWCKKCKVLLSFYHEVTDLYLGVPESLTAAHINCDCGNG